MKKTRHLRLVKFNLDSPRMAEAMLNLGLVKEDIDTKKTRNDFPAEDVRVTELQFQYYQKRMVETINSLLQERRKVRIRGATVSKQEDTET